MNKSIKTRIFAYFIGVEILILAIIWLGINFYIEDYYYSRKIDDMKDTIDDIELVFHQSRSGLELRVNFEYIGYQFGGKITIYDEVDMDTLLVNGVFYNRGNVISQIRHNNAIAYVCENNYPLEGSKWLIYGEELYNGQIAVLEIPIESIDNTLDVVKNFFTYLVLISIGIASIFAFVLSKSISNPVSELNAIAKEMGKLNFNKKYNGSRKDEIGQLGHTLNDITKRLEKTINNLQYELDKEKQLDILRKKFIGQVSHELQTPLSVINGYIEALEDNLVDTEDEKQYYYAIIEDETLKMSKMVRELLDLSQLEAGTYKMAKEQVDIIHLLNRITSKYEKIAQAKNIVWKYKGIDKSIWVTIDALRIEQAITNIINNAFKHTKENNIIGIRVTNKPNEIIINIENEGDQISENELGQIWESFYKANTSENKQGTGLGLAIAAHIFKHHNIEYQAYNMKNGVGFELIIKK